MYWKQCFTGSLNIVFRILWLSGLSFWLASVLLLRLYKRGWWLRISCSLRSCFGSYFLFVAQICIKVLWSESIRSIFPFFIFVLIHLLIFVRGSSLNVPNLHVTGSRFGFFVPRQKFASLIKVSFPARVFQYSLYITQDTEKHSRTRIQGWLYAVQISVPPVDSFPWFRLLFVWLSSP